MSEQVEYAQDLAKQWLEAKAAEAAWNDQRKAIEAKLESLECIEVKPDGSKTNNLPHFKVKTTGRVYKKVDGDAWEALRREVPEEHQGVFRAKYDVSKTKLRKLRDADPELFKRVAGLITSKPGSTGFSIEPIEES